MTTTDPDHDDGEGPRVITPRRRARLGIPGLRGALLGAGEPAPPAVHAPSKARQKQLSGKLAGLSLSRQVWVLSLWPLLEQVLNFLVGTSDLAIAGRLPGDASRLAAMEAIAVGGYFVWLMNLLQAAVGVGATAIVSRAIGASHRRLATAGVGQSVVLAFVSGCAAAALVAAFARPIASFMKLEGDALSMATDYLRICALAIPLTGVLFVGGACLRAAGDTRNPFLVMLLVNVINVVLSVTLAGCVVRVGGTAYAVGLGYGVAGIAAGTAVAWAVGGLIIVGILLSGRAGIKLRRHRLRPHAHTIKRIVRVALPNLAEQLAFWGINFAVLYYVAMLNQPGAYGSHMIAIRIESVSFLPGFAVAVAASTLTGQYLGLGDPDRARRATWLCVGVTTVLMTICGLAFWFIPDELVRLLSPDTPEHQRLAPPLLMIAAPAQPLLGVFIILSSAMRGAGDTRSPAILSFSLLITVRLIGGYLLAITLGLGLAGVWIAMMSDIALRGVAFWLYYQTGRWARAKV